MRYLDLPHHTTRLIVAGLLYNNSYVHLEYYVVDDRVLLHWKCSHYRAERNPMMSYSHCHNYYGLISRVFTTHACGEVMHSYLYKKNNGAEDCTLYYCTGSVVTTELGGSTVIP